MTLPHQPKVRPLSSLCEFLCAMGEEYPGTGWNVGGYVELEPTTHPLTAIELAAHLTELLLSKHANFRSRVCCDPTGRLGVEPHYWLEDLGEAFDPIECLTEIEAASVSPPSGMSVLEAVLEEGLQKPFPRTRPPWAITMVHFRDERLLTTRTILVCRIHHVIGDGEWMVGALLDVSRESAGTDGKATQGAERHVRQKPRDYLTLRWCFNWLLLLPWALYTIMVGYLLNDSDTPFHPTGKERGSRQVRLARPISLTSLKVAAKASGSTINDVLLAILAGTTRRYLRKVEGLSASQLESLNMSVGFTANLRATSGSKGAANHSIMFSAPLSLAGDVSTRIATTRDYTHTMKNSPLLIGGAICRMTVWISNLPLVRSFFLYAFCGPKYMLGKSWFTANIPGPRHARSMCGRKVTGLAAMVNYAPGVVSFSYGDAVQVILVNDAGHTDADVLRHSFDAEAEHLVAVLKNC